MCLVLFCGVLRVKPVAMAQAEFRAAVLCTSTLHLIIISYYWRRWWAAWARSVRSSAPVGAVVGICKKRDLLLLLLLLTLTLTRHGMPWRVTVTGLNKTIVIIIKYDTPQITNNKYKH